MSRSTGELPATSSNMPAFGRRGPSRRSSCAGRATCSTAGSRVAQGGRRAARGRGLLGRLRPGPHVRQPLRVLLHPSAAQGHAPQPVVKDDDYRLSFLYGNFTTLTRFTEMDLERVLDRAPETAVRVHPRHRSRAVRAGLLRNPRGATSLRWLGCSCDGGIEVHGQIVVCPGLQRRSRPGRHPGRRPRPLPRPGHGGLVPLGLSRFSNGAGAAAAHHGRGGGGVRPGGGVAGDLLVGARPAAWSSPPTSTTSWPNGRSRRSTTYEGFPQHENGIGMARPSPRGFAVQARRRGTTQRLLRLGRRGTGCGLPAVPVTLASRLGHQGPGNRRRSQAKWTHPSGRTPSDAPQVAVLTGSYGAECSARWLHSSPSPSRGRSRQAGARRQPLLRRQHRGVRPADRDRPGACSGARARGPPLPAARRLPVRGAVPRRTDSHDLPRPVEVVATDGLPSAGARRPDAGGRRPGPGPWSRPDDCGRGRAGPRPA